jgi:hypothetical protein
MYTKRNENSEYLLKDYLSKFSNTSQNPNKSEHLLYFHRSNLNGNISEDLDGNDIDLLISILGDVRNN